jgi:hypothetical protein
VFLLYDSYDFVTVYGRAPCSLHTAQALDPVPLRYVTAVGKIPSTLGS